MVFKVKETLDEADVEVGLRNIVRENLAFQPGASNFVIGLPGD